MSSQCGSEKDDGGEGRHDMEPHYTIHYMHHYIANYSSAEFIKNTKPGYPHENLDNLSRNIKPLFFKVEIGHGK